MTRREEFLWGAKALRTESKVRENPDVNRPAQLGMGLADLLDTIGLTGVRRIRMTRCWKENVRLAGALDQPIVLAGHSWDAADGMEVPAEFAAIERNVGGVARASPKKIARSNLEVNSRPQDLIDPGTVPAPKRRLWPVVRKILKEARDRTDPLRRRKHPYFDE